MCFLPRRGLSVSDCEIARAYKVAASSIEAIAFIVPRKVRRLSQLLPFSPSRVPMLTQSAQSDSFQSDIFPPAPSAEPALTAAEFFAGKTAAPKYVSLEDGSVSAGTAPLSLPAPAAPVPTPTRTATAPAPAPVIQVHEEPPSPAPVTARYEPEARAPARAQTNPSDVRLLFLRCGCRVGSVADVCVCVRGQDAPVAALREENARLTGELRDAREKIRNLELQVEAVRANARKAAALLDG